MDVSVFVFEVYYSLFDSTSVSDKNIKYPIISVSAKYILFLKPSKSYNITN
jgi:hypothetical protein